MQGMIRLEQFDQSVLTLPHQPKRLVSLVPSLTHMLCLWGSPPVARTAFCIEPAAQVERIPTVGGTKTPQLKKILDFKPDLILANEEENRKEDVEFLQRQGQNVWVTRTNTLKEALNVMKQLNLLMTHKSLGQMAIDAIETKLKTLPHSSSHKTVGILIWKNPWMAVGSKTYMHDLIETSGFQNGFAHWQRYPQLNLEDIERQAPQFLILPSEPYAFKMEDQNELEALLPKTRVICAPGETLTWPGVKMLEGLKFFESLKEGQA